MAKAAHVAAVFLVVHSFCRSQPLETASSPSCSSLEESLPECGASSAGSLLQVDRMQVKASEHVVHEPLAAVHTEDLKLVTTRDLLRHAAPGTETEPLQSTLDSLKDRVTSLETAVTTASDKTNEDDSDKTEESDETSRQGKGGKGEAGAEDQDQEEDWAWDDQDEDADNSSGQNRHLSQGSTPDWDGVAPNAWNGLEDVKAKDKGPKASWKGAGTGVSSGHKYKGEYPYEIMMDVDYLIDSNPPEPTKKPKGQPKAPSSGRKDAPKMPAKSGPKHGGKTSPMKNKWKSKPKVSPRSSPKSEPKPVPRGPKEAGKTSPREGGKGAPETEAKTAAKAGGKTTEAPRA